MDPNQEHEVSKWSPLHFAALVNDVFAINLLIDHGATIDPVAYTGETPLIVAIAFGNCAAVIALLERGASCESVDCEGAPRLRPLQIAVNSKSADVVAVLMRKHPTIEGLTVPEEMKRIVDGDWEKEAFSLDTIKERQSLKRIEDVTYFEYPEPPVCDPKRRYVDKRYVKEVEERNRQIQRERTGENDEEHYSD